MSDVDLYNGDCFEIADVLISKGVKINSIITSPPYFKMRDYGSSLGTENTVDEFVDNLVSIFGKLRNLLTDDGSCWVNLSDTYIDCGLSCVPDKFKIAMVKNGWICRNEIIWHKPNAMPSSVKNRFNNDYEKLFFFTKSKDYKFNTQYEPFVSKINLNENYKSRRSKYINDEQEKSVRQGLNKRRGQNVVVLRKSLPSQEMFVGFIREKTSVDFIVNNSDLKQTSVEHWFRKDSNGFSYPSKNDWCKIRNLLNDDSDLYRNIDFGLTEETFETDSVMKNADNGRVKRAVWSVNTEPSSEEHFAPFPRKLITTPILASSDVGDIILDPFMGSGTTGVVCKELNRNFIGIELNETYYSNAKRRIELSDYIPRIVKEDSFDVGLFSD